MAAKFSGQCLCGAVRFECDEERPVMAGNCHCRDCQRSSGGAYTPAMFFPKDSVKITGDVRYYEVTAESGNRFGRGFCPTCGSNLFGVPHGMPHLIGLRAGTLDEPQHFEPAVDIFVASAPHWHRMDADLPKFSRGGSG